MADLDANNLLSTLFLCFSVKIWNSVTESITDLVWPNSLRISWICSNKGRLVKIVKRPYVPVHFIIFKLA